LGEKSWTPKMVLQVTNSQLGPEPELSSLRPEQSKPFSVACVAPVWTLSKSFDSISNLSLRSWIRTTSWTWFVLRSTLSMTRCPILKAPEIKSFSTSHKR
jgi:hypothetical protein